MARGRNPRAVSAHAHAPAGGAFDRGALLAALAADPAASLAARALSAEGEVLIVGGAVRDVIMGLTPKDVDLLVRGIPGTRVEEILAALPGASKMTGRDFGVFRFSISGAEVEIALPRRERSTGDRHTDFEVDYDETMPVEEDLVRRDFTANAIAYHVASGELIDPHGGQADIAGRVLRAVSPRSFVEDPLRILRGLRAHARHGLVPDEYTVTQMADNAGRLAHLSAGRIGEEWQKLLETAAPAAGMRLARETGILTEMIGELGGADEVAGAFAAVAAEGALERVCPPTGDPDLRAAAYLAPLERLQPGLTASYLDRIVWPKRRAERIAHLHRMLARPPASDPLTARRLLADLGKDEAKAFGVLRSALAEPDSPEAAAAVTERRVIARVIDAGEVTSQRELAITGSDLIAAGIPAGPALGRTLRDLLARVVDDPALNERGTLLGLAAGRPA